MPWGQRSEPKPDFHWSAEAAITRLIEEGALEIRGTDSHGLYSITGPGAHGRTIDHASEVAFEMGTRRMGIFYLVAGSVPLVGHIKREAAKALAAHWLKIHDEEVTNV